MKGKNLFWVEPQSTLVGGSGKIIPIAKYYLTTKKARLEKVPDMLSAVGNEQFEFFLTTVLNPVLVKIANLQSIRSFGRFLGNDYRKSFVLEISTKQVSLGGFAGSVRTFKDNQFTAAAVVVHILGLAFS
jgi:hypothetical protein